MRIKEIDKFINIMNIFCGALFDLLFMLIIIALATVLIFGSIASIVLLCKLYPSIGILFLNAGLEIGGIFKIVLNIIIPMLIVFLLSIIFFQLMKYMKISRIRAEQKRENFINELAIKINKMKKNK